MLAKRCANRGSLSAIAYGNPVVCCYGKLKRLSLGCAIQQKE